MKDLIVLCIHGKKSQYFLRKRDEETNCLLFFATRLDAFCSRVVFDLLLKSINFPNFLLTKDKTSVSFNQFHSR